MANQAYSLYLTLCRKSLQKPAKENYFLFRHGEIWDWNDSYLIDRLLDHLGFQLGPFSLYSLEVYFCFSGYTKIRINVFHPSYRYIIGLEEIIVTT